MRTLLRTFTFLFIGFSLCGCKDSQTTFLKIRNCLRDVKEDLTSNPSPASDDPVVASVEGLMITRSDLLRRLQTQPLNRQTYWTSPRGRQALLNWLINEKETVILARKSGLENEDAIRNELNNLKESYLFRVYTQRLAQSVPSPSEEDILLYYNEHLSEFATVQTVYVLFQTLREARKAEALLKKGKFAGMKILVPGKDPPELENIAKSLLPGQISTVVKISQGYGLVKRNQLPPLPFDRVKESIRSRLLSGKIRALSYNQRKSMKIEINEKILSSLSLPVAQKPSR
jgi:peptidyl-prolyl cis-trans isomerase C